MRFFSFLIWIFLYVGQIAIIECGKTIEWNTGLNNSRDSSNWDMFFQNIKTSCSLVCNKKIDRAIVVQTANDNGTHINVPLQDDIMAVVYYNCNETVIKEGPTRYQYHTFQKLCDSDYEKCTNFGDSYLESWESDKQGKTPKFSVDLTVPSDLDHIKIRTEKCEKDRIIFTFKVDNKPIDYRQEQNDYNYTNDNFFVNNLQKMPIVLEIKKFPEKVLALITFNLTRTLTKSCTKFIHEHCPLLCRNRLLDVNGTCRLMLNKKDVEIVTSPGACPTARWNKNATEETVYEGACVYFGRRNITLCQYDCIDIPNCSYMCVMRLGYQRYIESGYYFHKNYTGTLGSRPWTWDNVPKEMVLVNECLELPGLCKNPKSCEDQDRGYRCKLNDYNNMTCLRLRKYNFIQCPHDMENRVANKEPSPNSHREIDKYDTMLKDSKLPPEYKYDKKLYHPIRIKRSYTNSTSAAKGWKKIFSRVMLKTIQKKIQKYVKRVVEKAYKTYRKTKDGIYTYSRRIRKTEKLVNIPLSEKNETVDNQFVKLKINQPNNSSNTSLVMTFMYYKSTDLAGESKQLEKIFQLFGVNQKDTMRYKNSDVIHLSINEKRNITIQFKLTRLRKVEPPSWLYAVEDECGYLAAEDEWRWSVDGCRKVKQAGEDYCECDHLSNFAMLFSLTMINEKHLTAFKYLSIVGSVINVLSLLLFLVFVLFINPRDKMRIDQLNIAISLLIGTLVFDFGGLLVKHVIPCKIAALLAQYLFLSAFVWMLILGINVVRMIASLNCQTDDWMVKYRLLIWAIGYGVPLFIVVLSGSFNWPDYGQVSDNVCWIDNRKYTLLSFIIPLGIIIALNVIGLFYIANTLIRNYINTKKIKVNESKELLVLLQLMVSMGLTWLPSYFATYYLTAMYLLVIFFPLQGLMMFLCIVVINKDNREKVSSYVLLRYSSLISKSTTGSETKSNPKWYSTSNSKNTEHNQSLLLDSEKEKRSVQDTKESALPSASIRDRKNIASVNNTEC